MKLAHVLVLLLFCVVQSNIVLAAGTAANYDEAKIQPHNLPDPLLCLDGTRITTRKQWITKRRPEILELFRSEVFGRVPVALAAPKFEVWNEDPAALNGIATRKQVAIWLFGTNGGPRMDLLLYLPNQKLKPAGVFLGLNFGGNHTVSEEPSIYVTTNWVGQRYGGENKADASTRGSQVLRWPIAKILQRGYALATAYYGDIEPDFPEGWKLGIRGALAPGGTNTVFKPDDWGAISAWAWGLSRAMDYLATDGRIDRNRVIVIGHSRLGKTALWAGAQDDRFAAVISNESGEGGAALARRNFGETTERINTAFPHWFNTNYKEYNGNEAALPIDAHMLIALSAPRSVYVASAEEDLWADPKGEFLALKAAAPVYRLFGRKNAQLKAMPPVNKPTVGTLSYHMRSGVHDIRDFDWDQYLDFADKQVTPRK